MSKQHEHKKRIFRITQSARKEVKEGNRKGRERGRKDAGSLAVLRGSLKEMALDVRASKVRKMPGSQPGPLGAWILFLELWDASGSAWVL